jgi:hypothetical protein
MRPLRSFLLSTLTLALMAAGCGGQASSDLVVSSDPTLAAMAAELLPDLAARAGMELSAPVRLEKRSRDDLVRYLRAKLDEDLPDFEAQARTDAYALLGMVEPDLDLRAVLLGLYTEQVAGFYEPDSTALFVLDDQPEAAVEALLIHELVHAVQDQNVPLDELTDPALGNDRATAAQAAIEGHATLVMFEYLTEQLTGDPVDLSQIPDFESQIRPALAGMNQQFPALAQAPRVIRESLLFPYIEGAVFVQRLWSDGARQNPFGPRMPGSTEQIIHDGAADPVDLLVHVADGEVVLDDALGGFEVQIMLEDVLGLPGGIPGMGEAGTLASSWDGDRYVLVESVSGERSLLWVAIWSDEAARDGFAEVVSNRSQNFGGPASVERLEIDGHPATMLRIGAGNLDAMVEVLDPGS